MLRVQRLAVPAEIRAEFLSAALAMFAAFALVGLFVSLVPSFLGRELHERNHAAAGIVVFVLFACATGAQLALHRLLSRRAMLIGFAWLIAGLALLMLGLSLKELSVFVVATICCGIGVGLVIMGALAMVNRIAPPEHRGETLSSLLRRGLPGPLDPGDRRRDRLAARRVLPRDARVLDRGRGPARGRGLPPDAPGAPAPRRRSAGQCLCLDARTRPRRRSTSTSPRPARASG